MPDKILVCSDTHGHIDTIAAEIMTTPGLTRIIHLGDHARDAEELEAIVGRTILKVKGNNDFISYHIPYDGVLPLSGGHKAYLTHGHLFGVYYGLDKLAAYAKSLDCDLVLFGHTHAFDDQVVDGIRLINPGSCAWPRGGDGQKSYIILTLDDDGQIDVDRVIL
ncbi:metallophosphoesterase family protein [Kallipyga massiliensis]|uniref:metallophosphoesterase family protein n=1 Tax=Kallipyga massiliensis TaxID=1472764 RepID=UPI0004B1A87F|nr:metallophosphoesterase [Kallipyga massiliensis]